MAEETDGQKFAPPCAAYSQFLEGSIVTNTTGCHPFEEFLVRHAFLSAPRFFSKQRENFKPASHFGIISVIGRDLHYRNYVEALEFLNAASEPIEDRLIEVGDPSRAKFYKVVIANLKVRYKKLLCSSACDEIDQLESFESAILEKLPSLEDYDPGIVFECLARTDSYGVPIQVIIDSMQFLSCLGKPQS